MDDLVTIAVIGLFVVAIHAAFAVYLYRSLMGSESETDSAARSNVGETAARAAADGPKAGATVSCPTCGTPNDGRFQFCRRCVSDLSDTGTPKGPVTPGE